MMYLINPSPDLKYAPKKCGMNGAMDNLLIKIKI